jgi:hypothetical protein
MGKAGLKYQSSGNSDLGCWSLNWTRFRIYSVFQSSSV